MDTPEILRRGVGEFDARVAQIGDAHWDAATPDPEWNVRDLVAHVVAENLWAVPLFGGATIAEVGDQFEGDILGADPQRSWADASGPALRAADEPGAMQRTVHLSFGDFPGHEYAMQLFADHLIHAWDLARAIGADESLDPVVVEGASKVLAEKADLWRSAGALGPAIETEPGADAQTELLAVSGRRV